MTARTWALLLACASAHTAFAEEPAADPETPPPKSKPEPFERYPLGSGSSILPLGFELEGLRVEAHLSVIAQYVLSLRTEDDVTDWFHEFELPRGHARVDASYEHARARVLVEAVRSASEGSLIGVAGDSFVVRMREAWGSYAAWGILESRLGLVPTMTTGVIESLWGMRVLAPSGAERANLHVPADLGGTIRGLFPEGWGWVGVGAYNGEGYAQRELNRGKNIELATAIHPLAFKEETLPLTVQLSYVAGSRGVALGRADRLTASLGWMGEVIRGGLSFTYAWGVDAQPDTESVLGEAFLRVMPIERLALGVNATAWLRDVASESDYQVALTGGAGYYVVEPLGIFLALDGLLQGEEAVQSSAPKDDFRLRVIGSVDF